MIADHERRDLLASRVLFLAGLYHRTDEVVIVLALVGEAAALRRHRDDARPGAVDQMEEAADAAVPSLDQGHRHPGGSVRIAIVGGGVDGLGHADRISAVAVRRERRMERAVAMQMPELKTRARFIIRKSACRQHDATPRRDADWPAGLFHDGAGDATLPAQ